MTNSQQGNTHPSSTNALAKVVCSGEHVNMCLNQITDAIAVKQKSLLADACNDVLALFFALLSDLLVWQAHPDLSTL